MLHFVIGHFLVFGVLISSVLGLRRDMPVTQEGWYNLDVLQDVVVCCEQLHESAVVPWCGTKDGAASSGLRTGGSVVWALAQERNVEPAMPGMDVRF